MIALSYNTFWKRLSDRDKGLLVSRISALFEEVQEVAGPCFHMKIQKGLSALKEGDFAKHRACWRFHPGLASFQDYRK